MSRVIEEKVKVNSEAIKYAKYDKFNELLTIKFHNGKIYSYIGVEPFIFEGLKQSRSIGKFINKYIIRNEKYYYAYK